MLLNDEHKQKLLEIVEQNPADIASLSNYLEYTLKLLPSDLKGEDKKAFKFFVIKSFTDKISNCQSQKQFKKADNLLEELKELWEIFFEKRPDYEKTYSLTIKDTTYYTELDFNKSENKVDMARKPDTLLSILAESDKEFNLPKVSTNLASYTNISHFNTNIDLKEKITIEQLNILLKLRYINHMKIYGNSLLDTLSMPDFEILLPSISQDSKPLSMKVFSIGDENIFNNFEFANAIIYLTDSFNQSGEADYSRGLTLCVSEESITSQYILPLNEQTLLGEL